MGTNRQRLIDSAKRSKDTKVLDNGAIVVYTGECTGRSPGAKYIALDNLTEQSIDWKNNQKMLKMTKNMGSAQETGPISVYFNSIFEFV